jgi:hypothetical protein
MATTLHEFGLQTIFTKAIRIRVAFFGRANMKSVLLVAENIH